MSISKRIKSEFKRAEQFAPRGLAEPGAIFRISLGLTALLAIFCFGGEHPWIDAGLSAAVFALAAVHLLSGRPCPSRRAFVLALPIAVLGLYSAAQGFLTLIVQSGLADRSRFLPYSYDLMASIWTGIKILGVSTFILLLSSNFRSRFSQLVNGTVVIGSSFALFGILRFGLQRAFPETLAWFPLPDLEPNVGFGTFLNQNHFGFLMLMNLGLCLGLLRWAGKGREQALLLVASSAVSWIAIVLTASRGAILSSFVLAAFVIFFPSREPSDGKGRPVSLSRFRRILSLRKVIGFLFISIILAFGVVFIGNDRVVTRFEQLPTQIEGVPVRTTFLRRDLYSAAIAMLADHPVFGVGFGGFGVAASGYLDVSGRVKPRQVHNDFLDLAVSGGMPAILLALFFLFCLVRFAAGNMRSARDRTSYAASAGALCALSGMAAHSLFDFSLQYYGNLFFAASILVISALGEESRGPGDSIRMKKMVCNSIGGLFLFLGVLALYFGAVRYAASVPGSIFDVRLPVPVFDAQTKRVRAEAAFTEGKTAPAIEALADALQYRPFDHELWLELARIRLATGNSAGAALAYQRAVELAPSYSEPNFEYGKLLVSSGAVEDGFVYLRRSFENDPELFYDVVGLAWDRTAGSVSLTLKLISPLDPYEAAMFNIFLLENGLYDQVAQFTCGNDELPAEHRWIVTQKLFEKRRYLLAARIARSACGGLPLVARFENGNFAGISEIDDGIGFGWRSNIRSPAMKLALSRSQGDETSPFLEVAFAGSPDPGEALMTQTVVARGGETYRVEFSYRTKDLVAGQPPSIQLVEKSAETDGRIVEAELNSGKDGWTQIVLEIPLSENAEAIEVRLVRKDCADSQCPIYGYLYLDDFRITQVLDSPPEK